MSTPTSDAELWLLTAGTPNGHKPSIFLEELKAAGLLPGGYDVHHISFRKNEQKEPWFSQINPNGRIPALVHTREDGSKLNVWESASILLYLAKTFDKEYKFWFDPASDEYTELLNWIFFLQGGVGPMQGQANHFFRYAPEKIEYGIKRYQDETSRLYGVYEAHLAKGGEYLVGNKFTIADICTFTWVRNGAWAGVSLEPFPHLSAWVARLYERPALVKGLDVPEKDTVAELAKDREASDKAAKDTSKWIMEGLEKEKTAANKQR